MLCAKSNWNWPVCKLLKVIHVFWYYYPWKKALPFNVHTYFMNTLHPRMLSVNLTEIGPVVLEIFITCHYVFKAYNYIIYPWRSAWPVIHLNKFESTLSKDALIVPYGMKPEEENTKSLKYNAKKETKSDGAAGAVVTTSPPPFHKSMVRVNSNSLK